MACSRQVGEKSIETMIRSKTMLRPLILGPLTVLLIAASAAADVGPARAGGAADTAALVYAAAADCSDAAAEAAARTGGRVLSVSSRSDGGRPVCVVTLLVPADGGGRPRKQTLVLPQ